MPGVNRRLPVLFADRRSPTGVVQYDPFEAALMREAQQAEPAAAGVDDARDALIEAVRARSPQAKRGISRAYAGEADPRDQLIAEAIQARPANSRSRREALDPLIEITTRFALEDQAQKQAMAAGLLGKRMDWDEANRRQAEKAAEAQRIWEREAPKRDAELEVLRAQAGAAREQLKAARAARFRAETLDEKHKQQVQDRDAEHRNRLIEAVVQSRLARGDQLSAEEAKAAGLDPAMFSRPGLNRAVQEAEAAEAVKAGDVDSAAAIMQARSMDEMQTVPFVRRRKSQQPDDFTLLVARRRAEDDQNQALLAMPDVQRALAALKDADKSGWYTRFQGGRSYKNILWAAETLISRDPNLQTLGITPARLVSMHVKQQGVSPVGQ